MKYSLIIPTYNEAPVIGATLRALRSSFVDAGESDEWEIIVVDNASTDGTGDAARAVADPHMRTLHLKERGKGRAVRAGFVAAGGSIVGFTDADLAVEPREIIDAFHSIADGGGEIIIGSRFHPHSVMPDREWWRTGSSLFFNMLGRTIVGVSLKDTQCPLKVMRKDGLRAMLATKEDTWFFDLEFLALAEALGLTIREVPVTWNEHRYPARKSKLSTVRDGVRSIAAMFRIRARLPEQLIKLRKAA